MRNKYIITALTCLFALGLMFCLKNVFSETYTSKVIKAGFIYIGDTSTAYTNNFYRAQTELSEAYPENVITVSNACFEKERYVSANYGSYYCKNKPRETGVCFFHGRYLWNLSEIHN